VTGRDLVHGVELETRAPCEPVEPPREREVEPPRECEAEAPASSSVGKAVKRRAARRRPGEAAIDELADDDQLPLSGDWWSSSC
jgi:hypothetical protein